jgi:hypothetical protein
MNIPLNCPDYSCLSKQLMALDIKVPKYKKTDQTMENIHAIAIDSTGLKRFGRGKWHQEKHKISRKASWRKLHMTINQNHYIEACELIDRFSHDDKSVQPLLMQITEQIGHFSADGAYDEQSVYEAIMNHSFSVNVVIPPRSSSVIAESGAGLRNRNIHEIKTSGRMVWQRNRQYGRRNLSEFGVQRYKRILGDTIHSREMGRQKQEANSKETKPINDTSQLKGENYGNGIKRSTFARTAYSEKRKSGKRKKSLTRKNIL